ncbi:MAG: hypothetical protein IJ785_03755 [Bacteroidales bacterium]|nr:hypothetical protein [Bacteroidales bacterium]
MNFIKEQFANLLRKTADKIESGNCELNEEQAIEIMKMIAHQPLSKEQAVLYLNMSTSKFDALVKMNKLPKGRKRMGFKEKVWYQDELDEYVRIINNE